jgi:hypothetical protein
MAMFDKVEFIGIVHSTEKFKNSIGQKIINRKIKKYFLLAAFLVDNVKHLNGLRFESYYPIVEEENSGKEGEYFTIIGSVENIKKDLQGFAHLLLKFPDMKAKFVFLGQSKDERPDVIDFRTTLRAGNCNIEVKTYNEFVDSAEFKTILNNTKAILPLIHENTVSGEIYFKSKISGSMNVALAHKIPLLLHEDLRQIQELQSAAVYYNFEDFSQVLENADAILATRERMLSEPNFKAQNQEEKYLKFVMS